MLPDAGAFELVFLAAVALIVVGPKDLPVLLRKVGQFIARMRGMAAEFRASFDELARQSELDELRKEVEALRNSRFAEPLANEVTGHMNAIEQSLKGETPATVAEPSALDAPAALAEDFPPHPASDISHDALTATDPVAHSDATSEPKA
jgi:sec-independent protein translocase protein TatB